MVFGCAGLSTGVYAPDRETAARLRGDMLGLVSEVAAKALLDRNSNPTETEVRYWLAGNLCRCTGYDKIVRAVLDTAAEMRG